MGVLEGNEAISVVRTMLGATNGVAATPGTIRGDFSISKQNNLIHGSDSPESACRESRFGSSPKKSLTMRSQARNGSSMEPEPATSPNRPDGLEIVGKLVYPCSLRESYTSRRS